MPQPPDSADLRDFTERIIRYLEGQQLDYAIAGSFAAMEYAEPRLSIDIDLMLMADLRAIRDIVAEVDRWGFYVTPLDVIVEEMIPLGRPFNIIDGTSGSKADIYPVADHGLPASAFERRRRRTWNIQTGTQAWFLAPEDVILYKLRHYRLGGEVSRKHIEDIARILKIQADSIESAYIERWSRELGVLDLWTTLWRRNQGI